MRSVTAIVTCYNQGDVIIETVESLLAQTYTGLRILVVDDGSSDPATVMALETLAGHPGGRVSVHRKENGHVSSARNFGIGLSDAEYVFVSDGDDIYCPGMIQAFVEVLDSDPSVGVVSSWLRTFGVAEWLVKPAGGDVIDFLHKNNCPGQALVRRSCWTEARGYDESMKQGYEDWDFYLSVTGLGWVVAIVPEPLIRYRLSPDSLNIDGYGKRLELISVLVTKHLPLYQRHVLDVVLAKEEAFQAKSVELLGKLRSLAEIPPISFGDGGIALGIRACRILGLSPTSASRHF